LTKQKCHEEEGRGQKTQRQQIRHRVMFFAEGIRDGREMVVFRQSGISGSDSTSGQETGRKSRSNYPDSFQPDESLSQCVFSSKSNRRANYFELKSAAGL
jgi:hypothetical protein